MLNRRDFLKASAGAVLSTAFVRGLRTDELLAGTQSLAAIGLQLYTVRELMQKDFAGTIEKVAKIGFKEVEFAGYFDHKPEAVRTLLDRLGLTAPAVHVPIDLLRDKLDDTILAAQLIGHRYLVCPWLSPLERLSLEKYKAHAVLFNKVGEACRKAGLQFAYHNHEFEFAALDGRLPYDVLLTETDAQLVQMEVDLFWIKKGGQEVLAYFDQHPGRFALCHVKDMGSEGD